MKTKFVPIESKLRESGVFLIVGIDEAGRGPLAGPVVCAAVILKKGAKLKGLKDSKLLTATKREELFDKIIKNSIDYSITAISHRFIDKHNILNAIRHANDICIRSLKIKPEIALIDGIDKQFNETKFISIIKGDRYIKSIAAASILAKVTRDKIMQRYHIEFPNYGFDKHSGYGTKKHIENIIKFGTCEIHRLSYNIRQLQK